MMWLAYTAATLLLFHRQTVHYDGRYESDISPYVLYMQGINVGYEYPYPIMFWVGKIFSFLFSPEKAMALAVTGLNCMTPLILKVFWEQYLKKETVTGIKEHPLLQALVSNVLLFAVLFVSMLYFPLDGWLNGEWGMVSALGTVGITNGSVGVFTPNPFHNATYLAARGFSVAAFSCFWKYYRWMKKLTFFRQKALLWTEAKALTCSMEYFLFPCF